MNAERLEVDDAEVARAAEHLLPEGWRVTYSPAASRQREVAEVQARLVAAFDVNATEMLAPGVSVRRAAEMLHDAGLRATMPARSPWLSHDEVGRLVDVVRRPEPFDADPRESPQRLLAAIRRRIVETTVATSAPPEMIEVTTNAAATLCAAARQAGMPAESIDLEHGSVFGVPWRRVETIGDSRAPEELLEADADALLDAVTVDGRPAFTHEPDGHVTLTITPSIPPMLVGPLEDRMRRIAARRGVVA